MSSVRTPKVVRSMTNEQTQTTPQAQGASIARLNKMFKDAQLLAPKDLSSIIRVAEATLADWRHERRGPRFHKMGTQVRYFLSDVMKWQGQVLEPVEPQEL